MRALFRRPGFVATAILSLAAGIGPNAAIFSLADGLGLRPVPIDRPDRLVRVFSTRGAVTSDNFSQPDYRDIAGRAPAFSSIAAYGIRAVALTARDRASEVVMLGVVSGNFFATLGARAQAGRLLGPADDTPGAAGTALISDRLWRERYAAEPAVSERGIELNGQAFSIAGVLPPDFTGLDPLLGPDVWVSLAAWPALGGSRLELTDRASRWLRVVARLNEGVHIGEASAQLATLMAGLRQTYPDTNRDRGVRVIPDAQYRERLGRTAAVVFGLVGLAVLLLACANVAGLLLAQAEERRHEMAVRRAIGASRARLIRQLLAESAALAAFAAAAGLATAWWVIRLLPAVIPPVGLPLNLAFRFDVRVVMFAVLVAAATIFVFGLAPALIASRADPAGVLKAAATGRRAGRLRVRRVLVGAQIAVSLALLTTTAFLIRGLWNLARVDAGFAPQRMVIAALSPSAIGYDEGRARAYYDELLARVRALPGVEAATLARRAPLSLNGGGASETVTLPGQAVSSDAPGTAVRFNQVAPRYFETMGTAIVRGREFRESDDRTAPRVAVVSEAFARKFWPGEEAVGKRIRTGPDGRVTWEIVGIARDGKYNALSEPPQPYIYFPFAQRFAGEATVFVRTAANARGLIDAVRQSIAAIDRAVPVWQLLTMDEQLRAATAVERITAALVGTLGAVGVFLALVGLYALVSFLVSCGIHEVGIRMALGARPVDITARILRQAAWPIGGGLAAGLVIAALVAVAIARSVYGISASDPLTYAAAASALATVALAATLLPARRATQVDPARVLRRD